MKDPAAVATAYGQVRRARSRDGDIANDQEFARCERNGGRRRKHEADDVIVSSAGNGGPKCIGTSISGAGDNEGSRESRSRHQGGDNQEAAASENTDSI